MANFVIAGGKLSLLPVVSRSFGCYYYFVILLSPELRSFCFSKIAESESVVESILSLNFILFV